MFKHIVNQQGIADSLKYLTRLDNQARDAQPAARALIQQFERWHWQPQVFEQALIAAAPGRFDFDADAECFTAYRGAGGANSAAEAVARVLRRYADLLGEAHLLTVEAEPQIFDTEGAADYLGLSLEGIKRYIHRTKTLKGTLHGGALIFTRQQLDDFKATMKQAGRPRTKMPTA